jgi:hypothetical protein
VKIYCDGRTAGHGHEAITETANGQPFTVRGQTEDDVTIRVLDAECRAGHYVVKVTGNVDTAPTAVSPCDGRRVANRHARDPRAQRGRNRRDRDQAERSSRRIEGPLLRRRASVHHRISWKNR